MPEVVVTFSRTRAVTIDPPTLFANPDLMPNDRGFCAPTSYAFMNKQTKQRFAVMLTPDAEDGTRIRSFVIEMA